MGLKSQLRHNAALAINAPRLARWLLHYSMRQELPSPEAVYELMHVLMAMATQEDMDRAQAELSATQAFSQHLADRYMAPHYRLEQLAELPPESMGRHFHAHMVDNGLEVDFFGPIDISDDLAFLQARAAQVHDYWHAIAGYNTRETGELAVVAFHIGNYQAHLGLAARNMNAIMGILAGTSMVRYALHRTEDLATLLEAMSDGLRRGLAAKSMLNVRFEELWERPMEELREELGVLPTALAPGHLALSRPR